MFDGRFDCDPADCDGYRADMLDNQSDSYVDYPVTEDNNSESAEEFGVDETYGVDSTENDEQAATMDFDGDFGSSDNGMNNETENAVDNEFENAINNETESAVDNEFESNVNDAETSENTNLDALYTDANESTDSEQSEEFEQTDVAEPEKEGAVCASNDPSDETAATCDDNCGVDCACGTTYAQKKCALDDYEIISDVLGCEKQLVKLYSTALCESAEEPLRDVIRENLTECAADQYATFEYMQKRGMYKTEQADEEKILQAKQHFTPLCDCND